MVTSTTAIVSTPIGLLRITANDTEIEQINFCEDEHVKEETSHPVLSRCMQELDTYFSGESAVFSIPLADRGTPFQKAVWNALRRIPNGKTISYGDLAQKAGYPQAARAVGSAMRNNPFPVIIPCHRVLLADGSVGQYVGGNRCKQWLLEHEKSVHSVLA